MPRPDRARILTVVLAGLALAAAAGAGGYLQLGAYSTTLGGDLTGSSSSRPFAVDLGDDLDFARKFAYEGRLGGLFGRSRLAVAGAVFDQEAEESISGFDFGGTRFEAHGRVTSKLRWAEGEYGFALLRGEQVRLELVGGVRLFRYQGVAEGTADVGGVPTGARAEISETGPVPHVGGALELRLPPFLVLRGLVKGSTLTIKSDHGSELDIEGTAGLRLGGGFEVGAGYRRFRLDVSLDHATTVIDQRFSAVAGYVRFSG